MGEIKINSLENSITQGQASKKKDAYGNFGDFIKNAIRKVNDSQNESNASIEKMADGRAGIHDAMIVMQKADITLRLFLQIRNKAIDAYREIMRMPF